MIRKLPDEKKIMREMAEIAFGEGEKTADRLRALDMLSELLLKQNKEGDAYSRLDALLEALGDITEDSDASVGSPTA